MNNLCAGQETDWGSYASKTVINKQTEKSCLCLFVIYSAVHFTIQWTEYIHNNNNTSLMPSVDNPRKHIQMTPNAKWQFKLLQPERPHVFLVPAYE